MRDQLSPYIRPQSPPTPSPGERITPRNRTSELDASHLRDYWQVVSKRRWLVLTLFLTTVLVTGILVTLQTPVYVAETTVLIEPQAPRVLDIRDMAAEQPGPEEYDYYKTQYEILRSQTLASRVIREQDLGKKNVLLDEEKAPPWWDSLRASVGSPHKSPPIKTHPLEVPYQLLEAYLNRLEIHPIQGTRLTRIGFSSRDPELSARIANAHANAYIRQGVELRAQANEEARQFLETKLTELKERIEKSEAELNAYRRDQQIISPDDKENIVVGRLVDLNKLLTDAEAEKIALEAQAHLLHTGSYEYIPTIANNPLIQNLKEQTTRLKAEYAAIVAEFKPGFPRVDQLKAQLDESQRRLTQEIQKIGKSIETSYLTAEAKEKALRLKVDAQKNTALQLKDASVTYSILAREVDTNRQLYDSVLQRLKEMGMATQLRASNTTIVDPAIPPLRPAKPKKALTLLLGALVGLVGGIGLSFFFEYLDSTLKNVERYLGLPTLALVPHFADAGSSHSSRVSGEARTLPEGGGTSVIIQQAAGPQSLPTLVLEAYRKLRTALLLSRPAGPPRTTLFTSGNSEEGKTATAVNTAISLAQMGARVLLIDADLRNPSCHLELHMENTRGLTEFLVGQSDLAELIKPTHMTRLFFISSGSLPPSPADLLSSRKMQAALILLRSFYDYIVIDSPPVLPVSDAEILSPLVDGVVLIVDSQQTSYQIARDACRSLESAQAKILGVVLNKVQLRSTPYSQYRVRPRPAPLSGVATHAAFTPFHQTQVSETERAVAPSTDSADYPPDDPYYEEYEQPVPPLTPQPIEDLHEQPHAAVSVPDTEVSDLAVTEEPEGQFEVAPSMQLSEPSPRKRHTVESV